MTTGEEEIQETASDLVSGPRFLFWCIYMISSFVLAYLAIAYRLGATSKMACWALVVAVADFRGASACFWTTRELLVRTQLGQPCFYGAHEGQEEEAGRRERGSGKKGDSGGGGVARRRRRR